MKYQTLKIIGFSGLVIIAMTSFGFGEIKSTESNVTAQKDDALKKTAAPKINKTEKTKTVDPLLKRVNEAIRVSESRYLSTKVHSPWQIMHGLLVFGHDYYLKDYSLGKPATTTQPPKTGTTKIVPKKKKVEPKKIRAIDWLSKGPKFRNESWFEKTTDGGRAHPYSVAYAFEGHPNQLLAILAMAKTAPTHQFKADIGTITINDMLKHTKANVRSTEEITWTLWALSHYLGPNAQWTSKYGEFWSIEKMVQLQTNEAPRNGACGGSHGLFALTYARNVYLKTGKPLRGVWWAADVKIKRYIAAAKQLQNADGTFSTEYFEGRGYSNDFETRLNRSGHTLEFLALALPQSRLKEAWFRKGVAAIADELLRNKHSPAKCGSLYHALSGLMIYRNRVSPQVTVKNQQPKKAQPKKQTVPTT